MLSTLVFEAGLSLYMELTNTAVWGLASESQDTPVLASPALELQACPEMPGFLHRHYLAI